MKHIEQIQPEYAADDMTALLLSDATASEALTALLHSVTGCAIPPLATTPESEVEELVPLCLSILRRHWTTPLTALGDGTTPMSLADLMRRLIGDRVQGNEAWSIPPANANIPTAVAALRQRDISSGLTLTLTDGGADGSTPTTTSLPNGLSLAQLLCSGLVDNITELQDSNKGWTMSKAFPYSILPNVNRFNLKFGKVIGKFRAFNIIEHLEADELEYLGMPAGNTYDYYPEETILAQEIHDEIVTLPKLHTIYNGAGSNIAALGTLPNCKILNLPSLRNIKTNGSGWLGPNTGSTRLANAPECLECYTNIGGDTNRNNTSASYIFLNAPKLQKFVIGGVLTTNNDKGLWNTTSTELVHLEIGGATCSLDMREWNPTTALSERLPEFLSNFKTYIANRLTDHGSGLTITLSQAVRDAIQQDPEIVSIITSKGWTISPAPSV